MPKLSKKTGLPLGKYVTRAAFAKADNERQRLKRDIYKLVMGPDEEQEKVFWKWREKFKKEAEFLSALKMALRDQLEKAKNTKP